MDDEEVWSGTDGVIAQLPTIGGCGKAVNKLRFFPSHCGIQRGHRGLWMMEKNERGFQGE